MSHSYLRREAPGLYVASNGLSGHWLLVRYRQRSRHRRAMWKSIDTVLRFPIGW
jgi:hypothetical protein